MASTSSDQQQQLSPTATEVVTSTANASTTADATPMDSFKAGDPVWFDAGESTVTLVPGIVTDYSATTQLVTIESAALDGNTQVFHVASSGVRRRSDFTDGGQNNDAEEGIDDMISLSDIHESALFWNLKKRYERNKIYTFIGNILVSMNPYKMFEIYGLNTVKKYQNQLRSAQPPHLFTIGNLAYNKMVKDSENQSILIMGESGSGKTENTKLLLQYLAAINKSQSNFITEQILDSIPLLESFGNAKTTRNNNASRYCKYIEIFFNGGVITGAKTLEFLHEKSRIVSHNAEERNFHIFYELLDGLSETEKEKYGLLTAEKYFYLNQGNCTAIDGKDDAEDFRFLVGAMQVLGFTNEEQDIIYRLLASILHLGNVYFHRKQYRQGLEGVEIGSDTEIRWVSHLLQLPVKELFGLMTTRTTETRHDRIVTPLNIDQALDMRDAISKVLYVSLFNWLVSRLNHAVHGKENGASGQQRKQSCKIALLDMFGFENLKENNFEQLCINYANELMYAHYARTIFRMEQAEYVKEKIDWTMVEYPENSAVLALISKKPIGILPLLEDESNFPKASNSSFLEKCHYNHALNELYSRARLNRTEFGVRHFEGTVWYSVEGFLEKNRDIIRTDVIEALLSSKMPLISKIFYHARESTDANRAAAARHHAEQHSGRFVTIKPRTPTVSARFQESLSSLLEGASQTNPWFIRCLRPNNDRAAMLFDDRVVYEQLAHSALVETTRVRAAGYPVRMKYAAFVGRYHAFLSTSQLPRGAPSKEVSRLIVEKRFAGGVEQAEAAGIKFGFSKIFLKEAAEALLERERTEKLVQAAVRIQAHIRGYLGRRRYRTVKRSVVRIQKAYRGYRQRKKYETLKRGIVRLQATVRMQRQKTEYEKIRALKVKREAERYRGGGEPEGVTRLNGHHQGHHQNNHHHQNGEQLSSSSANLKSSSSAINGGSSSSAASSANNVKGGSSLPTPIELPGELTELLAEMDSWRCVHAYNDIIKSVKPVLPLRGRFLPPQAQQLPFDIDSHSFAKFTNIYFRSHTLGAKREPIKAPFLQKNSDAETAEALATFKLILRFMNDNDLSGKKEKLLADYIVQKGLASVSLRDEIFCQLANQTWKNESPMAADRGWTLLVHCLSSFAPSPLLYKYLLKYVSDQAPNAFRPTLQRLLLAAERGEPLNSRAYPASLLEWKANLKKCGMAVEVCLPNGEPAKQTQTDSWTTAGQLTAELLHSSGFSSSLCFGWTVDLDDDGDVYSLSGDSYLLDMVSQMELAPSFPASKNYFIGAKNAYRTLRTPPNPYHNPELVNKFPQMENGGAGGVGGERLENGGGGKHVFLKSNVQRQLNQKMHRSLSGETLMRVDDHGEGGGGAGLGLAMGSRLNERYLKNHATSLQAFNQLIEANEELIVEEDEEEDELERLGEEDPTSGGGGGDLKLSEKSRLNQRYISNKNVDALNSKKPTTSGDPRSNRKSLYTRKNDGTKHSHLAHHNSSRNQQLLNQRSMSMQELGLASSSLNIRYFSRDKLNKTASLTGGSDNDSDSLNKVQSLMNFREQGGNGGGGGHADDGDSSSPNSDHQQGGKPSYHRKHGLMSSRPLPAEPGSEMMGELRLPGVPLHQSAHRNTKHHSNLIRPSSHSSTASSSFESDTSSCINDAESGLEQDGKLEGTSANGGHNGGRRKSGGGKLAKSGGNHGKSRSQQYLHRSHRSDIEFSVKSSAMSDTSEAPSLASHVRNIRIPSHTSELDQYLDDLFSPVLDANLDDAMSDARSLAQSIKGGGTSPLTFVDEDDDDDEALQEALFHRMDTTEVDDLLNSQKLSASLKGGVNEVEPNTSRMNLSQSSSIDPNALTNSQLQLNLAGLNNLTGQLDPSLLQQQVLQQQMFQMQQRAFLASTMQQNLEIQKQLLQQNQQLQQLLAQPVPPASTTAGVDQQQQQQAAMNRSSSMSSLAFPLPSSAAASAMTPSSAIAVLGGKANEPSSAMAAAPSATSAGKSEKSAVISAATSSSPPAKISIVSNGGIKMIPPPPPPPPPPPLSPGTDVFGRAKTVRIGKWRWPPPSEEVGTAAPGSNFIEFKRKKQIEKADKQAHNSTSESSSDGTNGVFANGNGQPRTSVSSATSDIFTTTTTSSSESSPLNGNSTAELQVPPPPKPSAAEKVVMEATKRSASIASPSNGMALLASAAAPKEHISRKYSDNAIAPGSIGKLRISSEMRAKLEQLTIDQSVRGPTSRERRERLDRKDGSGGNGVVVTSQSMDDLANMSSVKKLSETRKALLERQLMGSLRNAANFMETASTPNIKQTVDSVVAAAGVVVVTHSEHLIHGQHKKLSQESSLNSNYEPSLHVKKFIKNQQNLLQKSGSREFRERREELGPFNRLSSSTTQVNSYVSVERPLYTPERYFSKDEGVDHHHHNGNHHQHHHLLHHHHHQSFDADSHSAESSNERHSSSSGRFNGYNGHGFSAKAANGFGNNLKRMNIPPPPPPNGDASSLNGQLQLFNGNATQHPLKGGYRGHASSGRSYRDSGHFEPLEFPDSQADYLKSMNGGEQFANGIADQHLEVERQIKTKLYLKNEINFYAYSKPKFKLNMRKELFSPGETLDNPILVDLVFWQIVNDVYSGNCIRLNEEECDSLLKTLKAEGIHGYNPLGGYSPKAAFKRAVIEAARELPTYFARLYVVSGGGSKQQPALANVDYLAVSHSAVHLLKRERDSLTVIEKLSFDDISEILIPSSCTLQILFNGGDWITLYSNKALQIRHLVEKFIVEYQQTSVEYVRAIRDVQSSEPSVLSFKKDNIIRVVKNKHLHLAKGWSFGVLEFGESGLFQTVNVVPLTVQQVQVYQRQMDEESMRAHHPHHIPPHQTMMMTAQPPTTNGFNNHHHHLLSVKDAETPSLENGSNQEFNSLWIESRAETVTEEGKLVEMNGGTNGTASMSAYGDGNFSLLQFALFNFRECLSKYDLRGHLKDNSIRGSIKMIENLKTKKKSKGKGDSNDWTWSELACLVKYSKTPIQASLLMLTPELSKVAVECFSAIMRYMGDLAMVKNQNEVDCVYTILVNCHKYGQIRDEIYCQLMKQTTSNKSPKPDSCQRGWRLFGIVAAYFDCSEILQPYLFKYLETAAYDKRRAFHVTASIALTNLKKTFKYGGRKNVPSIEEIAAISAGRTSKRQMYRLPGGTERVLNTSCTTVVADIIEEICLMLNVNNALEMEEFSLYCIIEGDPFTMPLNRDEYILDVTTELLKNGQLFYLIFCRSVWYHPLRLDSHLYIEVVFNQVAPDYLEGLLIILPHEKLPDEIFQEIARIAALLHRAAEMEAMPSKDEIKYLLPKPVLAMRTIKPHQWVEMVQNHWNDVSALLMIEAKAQCLDILHKWPLFGSCFFAVKRIQNDSHTHPDHILALNKDGVHFLDMVTHEKVWKHPYSEVISTRKVRSEDGTLYLDVRCGNLLVQKITRIQTDQAHEISRLIRQYIDIEQSLKNGRSSASDTHTGNGKPLPIDQQ